MSHNFRTPTKATSKAASVSDDRLPGRPTPKFLWAAHPDSWEFIDGQWLPRLKKIPLVDGVNGCRKGPYGHIPVLNQLRIDRFIPLDDEIAVKLTDKDGKITDDAGYMVKWEGQRGAHYADIWATPHLVGSGRQLRVDWSTGYDVAGFNAWRLWLVESGTVPKPTPAVLAQIIKLQGKRANRRVGESHDGNPHVQAHVKREQDKLEAMKASAEPPKPRRARAKRQRASVQDV